MKAVLFNENISAEDSIGKLFQYKDKKFRIESIIAIGNKKIVYELFDLYKKEITHVLKVFRDKDIEAWEHGKKIYEKLKSINIPVPKESIWLLVEGWPVIFQKHLAPPGSGKVIFSNNSSNNNLPEKGIEIISLMDKQEFLKVLEICDELLNNYPMHPWYMMMKVEAHYCILGLLDNTMQFHNEEMYKCLKNVIEIEPDNKRAKQMWDVIKNHQ